MALLQIKNLTKFFPLAQGFLSRKKEDVKAVDGVTLDIEDGETLGLVGESGCGKSTLGRCVIRLIEPTSGDVIFEDQNITDYNATEMREIRRKMQIIFQDPYSSLNPRLTVDALLREVIRFHDVVPAAEVDAYISELIKTVGLREEARVKYPHEFSGGQRQRIGIARALAVRPEFLVADEPVSALDVSIQAQVLNLMMDLKAERDLTLLFVSHDLKVIEHFCDRVLVMYLGFLVEELRCEDLPEGAKHPYTQALLGANPVNDPDERRPLTVLQGDVPSPYVLPPGCAFAGRCPIAVDRCHTERPPLVEQADGHRVACWEVEPS